MKENLIADKSLQFGIRVVKLNQYLRKTHREFSMSDQILRCGTSIGANIAESEFAQSDADFISKISIAQKEAGETLYWLRLLKATNYIDDTQFQSMETDVRELLRIIASILIKMKAKSGRKEQTQSPWQ